MAFHDHLQPEIAFQRFTEEEDEDRVPWMNNSVNARQQNFMQSEPEKREKSMDRSRSEINCETEELRDYKAKILNHPLYDQLLSAHVSCLRIATPVDQLPGIDAQLQHSQIVLQKYSSIGIGDTDHNELDHFMTHYVLLLCAFKEQLQQHVRVHAMEAVMACWDLEQSLQSLTGVSSGEGTGATMSDDEEEHTESNAKLFNEESCLDGIDTLDFGPPILTETERSLMERVRLELKHELKQADKDYNDWKKNVEERREIVRKETEAMLHIKAWWQSHSKCLYPTEEDKARLVQETGLQLKQVNNWFNNRRKRSLRANSPSSCDSKTDCNTNLCE